VEVRVRLSTELARLAGVPRLSVELGEGATVTDLMARVAASHPGVGDALRSALPVIAGAHASRERPLRAGEEVALLLPVAGG
jgi:molybdopterin synthase sulfur carrier subunit